MYAAELGDVKIDGIVPALAAAKASDETIKTLTTQVNELGGKVKGVEELQGTLKAREDSLRAVHVEKAWAVEAAKHGLKPAFLNAGMKLAKLDGVKFDPKTNIVSGLSKEIFDGVKTECPDMFGGEVELVPTPKDDKGNGGAGAGGTPVDAGGAIGTLAKAFATPPTK